MVTLRKLADAGSLASVSMFTPDGREARFMSEEDMKNVGITSGVKKVLKAVKGSQETTRVRAQPTSPARGKKQKTKK